jgi:glyoxylase-like metal-dependent hydrolase (beta-lactamase superfamily II)
VNPLESQLCYPFEDRLPDEADWLEVAPDLFWIRMPLPFVLDHINLWLLRDRFQGRDGWTLIDCGFASAVTRGIWERLFTERLQGLPIIRVVCTHMHPDHIGLADWITRRFGAPLWMTLGEYAFGRVLTANLPGADEHSAAAHFRVHRQVEVLTDGRGHRFASLVPGMPTSFTRIMDDTTIAIGGRNWQVIVGRGHSPEHAALYCAADRLLISGDMVLPRISTNCSVWDIEPLANPVEWFLSSLSRFDDCAPDTLVLPSHGRPFRRLAVRIGQLRDHHDERLAKLYEACRVRQLTAAEAIPVVFDGRRFNDQQFIFALGEALAHLHALWYRGKLDRLVDVGQGGLVRFAAA